MTDDITPIQSRIAKIAEDERLLNSNRKSALEGRKAQRDQEKRTEDADLAKLGMARNRQMELNAEKERKFQDAQRREGEELVNASREIQSAYAAEVQRRKEVGEVLQGKAAALETRLRNIKAERPS